jgi:hypothetical protein
MACGFLRSRKKTRRKKVRLVLFLLYVFLVDNVEHASLSLLFFGNEKKKRTRYIHSYIYTRTTITERVFEIYFLNQTINYYSGNNNIKDIKKTSLNKKNVINIAVIRCFYSFFR